MKKQIISLLFLFIVFQGFSKDTTSVEKPIYKHQIGINSTEFLRQVISLSNQNILIQSPYLLTYSYSSIKNHGFRTGIGFTIDNKTVTRTGTTLPVKLKNFSFQNRIGYQYNFNVHRRVRLFLGADFVSSYFSSKSVVDDDFQKTEQSETGYMIGGGGVGGLQYYVGKRISLGTEVALYNNYSVSNRKTKITSDFDSFEDNENIKSNSFKFTLPTTIYILVNF